MTASTSAPITGISLVVDDDWFGVPVGAGEGEAWADGLVSRWTLSELAAATLRDQLVRLQANVAQRTGGRVSVLVWVPVPASGYCGATVVATNWPLGDGGVGDVPSALDVFDGGGFVAEGDTVLEQRRWSGEFEAGPFAAIHRVTSSPAGAEETVVETVDYVVFPGGSSQWAHLLFYAESISAFDDMPSQTMPIAESVRVTLGDGA
jgi:hypothetical protein